MVLLASLLACSLANAVFAQSASLFPVGFGTDDGLQGEIVGTGSAGTTYVLSGTTSDVPFTLTLVEGSTAAAETFGISALSLTVAAECIVTGTGLAVCDEFVQGGQSGETQTIIQTVSFEPFAIAVTSGSALPSSSGSSTSSSSSATSTRSQSTITALSSSSSSTSSTSASASATQSSSASASMAFSSVSWTLSAAALLLAALS